MPVRCFWWAPMLDAAARQAGGVRRRRGVERRGGGGRLGRVAVAGGAGEADGVERAVEVGGLVDGAGGQVGGGAGCSRCGRCRSWWWRSPRRGRRWWAGPCGRCRRRWRRRRRSSSGVVALPACGGGEAGAVAVVGAGGRGLPGGLGGARGRGWPGSAVRPPVLARALQVMSTVPVAWVVEVGHGVAVGAGEGGGAEVGLHEVGLVGADLDAGRVRRRWRPAGAALVAEPWQEVQVERRRVRPRR